MTQFQARKAAIFAGAYLFRMSNLLPVLDDGKTALQRSRQAYDEATTITDTFESTFFQRPLKE